MAEYFVSAGETSTGIILNAYDDMYVLNQGTANSTTVNSDGTIYVSSGGTASDVYVNYGGYAYLSSGASAHAIKENGGCVEVADGADVTFVPNTFSDLLVEDDVSVTLHSGTTANSTTVDYGEMRVYSGGVANDTSLGGFGTTMYVHSGGIANGTKINMEGTVRVLSGGVVTDTTLKGGSLYYEKAELHVSSGGTASDTIVKSNACTYVSSGGIIKGSLNVETGGSVSAYAGAIIDFTVAEQSSTAAALINDWSRISGRNDADYTITVNAWQVTGTYLLAGGANDFNKTVTVKTTEGATLGTITVGGTLVAADQTTYDLNKSGGNLSFSVTAPMKIEYTLSDSYSGMYDGHVHSVSVTVTTPVTGASVYYSTDNKKTWKSGSSYSLTNTGSANVYFKIEADSYKTVITNARTISIAKRAVTIKSGDAAKTYDGTPLKEETVSVASGSFAEGEGFNYSNFASQTEVGSKANTFDYSGDVNTKISNYSVTQEYGTLTVTPRKTVSEYNATAKSDMIQFVNGLVYVTHDTASGYMQTPAINDITGWNVTEIRRDLTGDGLADIQITSDAGDGSTWVATLRNDYYVNGCVTLNYQFIGAYNNVLWSYLGSADVNNDGKSEVLMMQTDAGLDEYGHRNVAAWVTDSEGKWVGNVWVGSLLSSEWSVAGTADVTGDGEDNILLRRADGMIGYWSNSGTNDIELIKNGGDRVMMTTGDFDGNGSSDFLWLGSDGNTMSTWSNVNTAFQDNVIGEISSLGGNWGFAGVGDYNGDGKDEILWCNSESYKVAYGDATAAGFKNLTYIV